MAKSAKSSKEEALTPAQQVLLQQRRLVLIFHILCIVLALVSCLFDWYRVSYGEAPLFSVAGSEREEGKLFMAACGVAFFFASFNLLSNEEMDRSVFLASLGALGALGYFIYTLWSSQDLFEEVAAMTVFEETVKKGEGGPLANIRIAVAPALWWSGVGAFNMGFSSLYLAFLHPRLATGKENAQP